jgi:hypothetical protein
MAQTIQILQPVGDWPAGVIVSVKERHAERLVRTGYAVAVKPEPQEPRVEESHGRSKSRHRV